jgi:hypothetical protein
MNHIRTLVKVVSFALASIAAVACHREPKHDGAASVTSVTGAKVPIAAADAASEQVCKAPGDEPAPTTAVVPAPKPSRGIAAAPAKHSKAKHDRDEAIAPDKGKEARQDATRPDVATPAHTGASPEAPPPLVTTTGATLSRVQPAQTLAPARIAFENRLPATYQLERVRMLVDGAMFLDRRTPGGAEVGPGEHVVEVVADYRLNDPVFTYMRDYRVELRSTQIVPASPAPTAFVATARPAGGVTTPMARRAALAWRSFLVK